MATLAPRSPVTVPQPKPTRTLAQRQQWWGVAFLSPWIIGFLIFYLGPMIASLVFSFTPYNPTEPGSFRWTGLTNWQRMLVDPSVRQAFTVTLRFLVVAVPLQIGLALLFALLLNAKHLWGKPVFRSLFFLPMMIPFVAGTVMWLNVFNGQSGWINLILGSLGIAGPGWLLDEAWVTPTLSIMGIWGIGNTMLVLLAGLQGVPTELYEAARVDGAGPLYSFFRITIPLISPVLFYNLVLAVIGGFQEFLRAYVMFNGTAGPGDAGMFYMFNLYKEAFVYFNTGYASALAWGMFIVALLVTGILFGTARRWVYYAAGD